MKLLMSSFSFYLALLMTSSSVFGIDQHGIAITFGGAEDLGALADHFEHVIAVNCDANSMQRIMNKCANCKNVSFCEKKIAQRLDRSSRSDATTFKQLIYDYVLAENGLSDKKVSFINCDIGGEEEELLEDVLYFAYHNECAVQVSFNIGHWKSKTVADIEYLFPFFITDCPSDDIATYLQQNPVACLTFLPLPNKERALIKKNMPAVIIGYNLVSYIRNMVNQLEPYTQDIIIVDNNSSFQPLLDYYEQEYNYTVLRLPQNYGHCVYRKDFMQKLIGDAFILTDPDLEFNQYLPDNFLETFIAISDHFNAGRVGFALSIEGNDIRPEKFFFGKTIKEWESQFWKKKVAYAADTDIEMYEAPMDSTFCFVNKKRNHDTQFRVAGDFTCRHLPWYNDYKKRLQPGELEAYKKNNICTQYMKK